jgi:hypothetical protein
VVRKRVRETSKLTQELASASVSISKELSIMGGPKRIARGVMLCVS